MKRLLTLMAVVLSLGLTTAAMDAEAAKRMGSGKSMGTQRQATADKAPAAATPAAAPAAGAAGAAGAAAATPSRSWMGPVAGLAAGLGLAALASHLGFGEELASMLMIGLLAAAVMVAVGFFMRKRAAGQQAQATQGGGLQYAHVNAGKAPGAHRADQGAPAYKVALPAASNFQSGSGIGSGIASAVGTSRVPADFDSASFERNAKANFIRLQAAHDANDLDDIRKFTTPGMFAELQQELANRGTAVQKTEVLSLHAEVVEVVEEVDHYVVSVRFHGVISDGSQEPDESFDEVWHLTKARQDNSGWVLSGIQQMS